MAAESRRRRAVLFARALVGIALAIGAALLLLHGRGHFERLGLPDRYRVGLGIAEIAAGLLYAFPATVRFGTAALLAVLAWAAGLHAGIREPAGLLYVWMAVVALLAHLDDGGDRLSGDETGADVPSLVRRSRSDR